MPNGWRVIHTEDSSQVGWRCTFFESDYPIAAGSVSESDMNDIQKKPGTVGEVLFGVWWISWFGIIGGFLLAGVEEYRRELSQGGAAAPFSLTLVIVVVLSWVVFYIATSKFEEQWPRVWRLFTAVGSILAVITLLGIYFFVYVAPSMR